MFYHFPYLKGLPELGRFFDIPSRFLGLTSFCLAVLVAFGFHGLLAVREGEETDLPRPRRVVILLLGFAGLLSGAVVVGLTGTLATRKAVTEPPVRVLRNG